MRMRAGNHRLGPLARRSRVLAACAAGLTLAAVTLSGPAPAAPPPPAPATSQHVTAMSQTTGVRTYAAVGDSITAGHDPADNLNAPGTTAWLRGETAAQLVLVGGWAVPGTSTSEMAANVTPVAADVLVVMAGTNDITRGMPYEVTEANLRSISATVGARTTLLVAIPPNDYHPPGARAEYNGRLAGLAAAQGWRYYDPWGSVSAGDRFAPGTTFDGVHATPDVALAAGRVIGDRTWQVAARRTGR